MDRLRQLLNHIHNQLGALTVSQRLAIGLCAALASGSVLWLLQWSATPEMVPVVAHDFSSGELTTAEEGLRANGISYKVQGTRLFVSSAQRYEALRVLNAVSALPEGSLFDMHSIVTDDNPFQAPEAREYAQNYAKGNELAKIIATYPYIKKASVLISPATRRRIGGPNEEPTASVTVTLGPGKELTFDMVEALARLVSGAVGGLKPYNVTVIDGRTIQSFKVPRPEESSGFDHFRMAQKLEERLLQKVRSRLADIPGVLASVTVELDTSKRLKTLNVHDVPQPKVETQQSSEQSSGEPATEPGVQANVGQALSLAAAGSKQTTENSSVENFEPRLRESETIEQGPSVKKVTATVSIPRSFIVGVYRANNPEAAEPKDDDPKFQALRDQHIARVKAGVEKVVMAKSPNDVQVDVYPDMEWGEKGPSWQTGPAGTAAASQGVGSFEFLDLMTTYGPQAGLALLALVSLMLMMRTIRRSGDNLAGTVMVAGAEKIIDEPVLPSDAPVGKAAASDAFLVGKEVDDESLRYAELTSEVSKMVEEDPKGAADLLRRWLGAT